MRRLLLMRHAKSDWTSGAGNDKDRPLNHRGRRDAPLMATWLAQNDLTPGYAVISTATRTRETWSLMEGAFDGCETGFFDILYHAGPEDMLDVINIVESKTPTLMLLAHQPGMAALTRMLARGVQTPDLAAAYRHFPTAAIAVLESPADNWHDVAHGSCTFTTFQRPTDL